MSFPYVIWTLRRTGGTTLTAFVNEMSEHPTVQHEPFNEERTYGHVTRGWWTHSDPEQLRVDMRAALGPRPVIKHCFELVAPELNQALLEVSTAKGYRHIILDRRDEVGRILSLELAKITGVWGKVGSLEVYKQIEAGTLKLDPINISAAVTHLRFCEQRRAEVRAGLAEIGQPVHEVFFEDVYIDFKAGRRSVRALLDFIEIDPTSVPKYQAKLANALKLQGQNSARIIDLVPNIAEAREALEAELQALQRKGTT